MPERAFDPAEFGPAAESHRPSLCGLDAAMDEDLVDRCCATGAKMMLTGQGGDALFYQHPTADVAIDALRARGWRAFASPLPTAMARWLKVSTWQVMGAMWRARRTSLCAVAATAEDFITSGMTGWNDHPWLVGVGDLPPAKRHQVVELVACAMHFGDCRRARAVDVVHPLLSQPILEHCLAIPTEMLTQGWRDRALARETFADRLPVSVVERWSKGELSRLFGQRLAANLDGFRDHLLDGRLADHGFIDRDKLDAKLTPERLIWEGGYGTIVYAAFLETWARHWEARIAELRPAPGTGPAS